mmetsp:Transcript_29449/g.45545  ORF Transcript_29449/g.45545 Transcript_29449/m.45545 type:complete len:212 (+) Transcript_29449:460-1095(+)
MGPLLMTSPIAYTLEVVVSSLSFTAIKPRLSVITLAACRFKDCVNGRRPIQTRTLSHDIVSTFCCSPVDSTVNSTPFPVFFNPVALVETLNDTFSFFCRQLTRFRLTSASTNGRMRSENSTTVTLLPALAQTLPSSRPITPPPIITRCFGGALKSSAPVELKIFCSSNFAKGSGIGSEPVARMIFFACTSCAPPLERMETSEAEFNCASPL